MCAEHFRIVLDDSIGFALPNGTAPSLIIAEIVCSVLVYDNITQFAVNDVGGCFANLHSVGHKRRTNEQVIAHCTQCLNGPITCILSETSDTVVSHIGLEALFCHFLNNLTSDYLCGGSCATL